METAYTGCLGSHIYAEIHQLLLDKFRPKLGEGMFFIIRDHNMKKQKIFDVADNNILEECCEITTDG